MITIKNLTFQYQNQNATTGGIRDINLEIDTGECVLICGRSGCGKSTMIKLLNGLIPTYYPGELSGEIWIDGKRIDGYQMYELFQKVGTVFQNPRTQFFNVDVNSEIVFGMENAAMPYEYMEQRRQTVLHDFELEALSENSIFDLSGGEKQRLAFGSVYALNPNVYLLDEPSSNLDSHTIQKMTEYIQTIKDQGKTIIVAEHRLYYLMDVVDRILYMENGRITKDMTRTQFESLTDSDLEEMGLRTRDIRPIRKKNLQHIGESSRSYGDLEMMNLSLVQGERTILGDVNIRANRGDIIGITGRNGVGKTTLIRYLCGLHKNGFGSIKFMGKELDMKGRIQKSYIVMQDVNYQLFAESVLAECSFGLNDYDEDTIEQYLRKFDLWDLRYQHPNTLSGGQKQRLCVITGCVSDRKILIFDEPTSGLDYDSMLAVADMMKEIAKDRILFVVTHDDEFIAHTCTGIIDLERYSSVQVD